MTRLRLGSIAFAGLMVLATSSRAADTGAVPAPVFKVGDSWVFDQTIEKGPSGYGELKLDMTVERVDEDAILVGVKRDGAPRAYEDHAVGADWSQRRVVDGQETVTTRPFKFPMSVGQSWTVDFTDPTRRGAQLSDHVHRTYKVVGWEDITVPAGTFHALKVTATGVDSGAVQVPRAAAGGVIASDSGATTVTHIQRGGNATLTRATYAEFYYVPSIKNYVKSVEEQYSLDNVRTLRQTRVLTSLKPSA